MSNNDAEPLGPAGSSGYVYTDLSELDEVIGGWRTQGDDVRVDVALLTDAYQSPGQAPDPVTDEYLSVLATIFSEFYQHTDAMSRYIDDYAAKLAANRQVMAGVEEENTAKFSPEGGA